MGGVSHEVFLGDSRKVMDEIDGDSIDLSVWSPPYNVGKSYEEGMSNLDWINLLSKVILAHSRVLKPGGFMAVNIADILAFPDERIPRFPADVVHGKRSKVTRDEILQVLADKPDLSRRELAELFDCSEQTIDRRLNGVNIRGGKYATQTRVKLAGGVIENLAYMNELYLYDRRIWHKDPAWASSKWTANSYRSVDEFEYVYIFWKPGVTTVDRCRLTEYEWAQWGSRGVWQIPSVRTNDVHEAMFPVTLPFRLIRLLTVPGDIVLDPFVGSGTTGVAAVGLGRHFIGIDKDPKAVEVARERIAESMKDREALEAM